MPVDDQEAEPTLPAGEQESGALPALVFSHNVIEHLGIKLYQNKVLNVLAELVANSWDAGAKSVWIDSGTSVGSESYMLVADSGCGMDFTTIANRYLVIGKPKRSKPTDKAVGNRAPMGRKGIGKLAPFGVARVFDVVTAVEGKITWFTLKLDDLLALGPAGRYKPEFHLREVSREVVDGKISADQTGQIAAFLERIQYQSGTMILLRDLTANELPSQGEIAAGLADRFTVILARHDFVVNVLGQPIDTKAALPVFEFNIPDGGDYATDIVEGKPVRYWAGFVGKAEWPADEAGVGIYCHGKIAQERPYFFGAKGKEVFARYMYAVVEADWLDELETDLVSTDRTRLNWEDPATASLKAWGEAKVKSWLGQYERFRAGKGKEKVKEVAKRIRGEGRMANFSDPENEALEALVAEATSGLGKDSAATQAHERFLIAISEAWMNLPTRRLLKDVWDQLAETPDATTRYEAVVSKLQEHSVPEAMGLAVSFAQRAYALTLLEKRVGSHSETKLQRLVEEFPWILNPRGDVVTADQHLKTSIDQLALEGDQKGGVDARIGSTIREMSEQERADFVFLSDANKRRVQIIEIKGPEHVLTMTDRRQLTDYLDFVSLKRPKMEVSGLLIGGSHAIGINSDSRIDITSWSDVLLNCRAVYVELVSAMIVQAGPGGDDPRLKLVYEFGGAEVAELLRQIASKEPRLKALMEKFEKSEKD
jgi:hypothetical protein